MEIIGRTKEKSILNQVLASKQAEFVTIYGRRRVGKTFLIRNCVAKKGVYFECSGLKDGNMAQQLANFTQKFSETFYASLTLQPKKNWREAFELLTLEIKKIPKKKKVIIFLDELPWLATPRSKLIQNLDYFWNTEWSQLSNCKLIVCGSAASWILNNLINAKGGLYNRVTKTILLEPFTLEETKKFLESKKIKLHEKQIVDLYIVMGGIPFYLNQIQQKQSMSENINAICFEKDGLLYTEFPRLFKSLFDSPEHHVQILKEIAKSRYGISFSALVNDLKSKAGGRFSERLNELEACGFIKKYFPHGREKRDCFYRIVDEYTLFYLKWIKPIVDGERVPKGINYFQKLSQSPSFLSWAGFTFEGIVYKHAYKIIQVLGLEKVACFISQWRYFPASKDEDGAQIDLLIERDDNAITICEIKYSKQSFVIDKAYAKILVKKMEVFEKQLKQRKQLFLAMITANGLKQNAWSDELITKTVEIKDLF